MTACACMARMRCTSACSARTARRAATRPRSPSAGPATGATACAWRKMMDEAGHRLHAPDRPLERLRRRHRLSGRDLRDDHLGDRVCSRRRSGIIVFGTVHAPLFHPLIAAKQMVTADHVGQRPLRAQHRLRLERRRVRHVRRRRQGSRGALPSGTRVARRDALAWTRDDFDYDGEFYHLRGVREKPKPYGGTRPLMMNAGASAEGRAFALRNCDALFTSVRVHGPRARRPTTVRKIKAEARARPGDRRLYRRRRRLPTDAAEAEEYHRYVTSSTPTGARSRP